MIKLTINHPLSHLPLSQAKGIPQQRIQKAVELNDEFFENIKCLFSYGDISPNMFVKVLQKTAKTDIPLQIMEGSSRSGKVYMDLNDRGEHVGYAMLLPLETITNKISRSSTPIFMHETMHFLERILNPKYNKRDLEIFNKGYNGRALKEFYDKFLYTKKNLDRDAFEKFLDGKSPQEQIDILQNIRYNLILELNAHKYTKKYLELMRKKFNKTVFYPEKPIEFRSYHFSEKIKYIEQKLAKIIKAERSKLAKN